MADSKSKEDNSEAEETKKSPVKWIILGLVLVLVAAGGGIFLAPKFMKPPPAEGDPAAKAESPPPVEVEEPPVTVQWPPFVVDVRDEQGGSRHIKMVVTLEAKNERFEEEVRAFGARGRQAVLRHLRSTSFNDIVNSDKFEALSDAVSKTVKEAIGKDADGNERVMNVLITELVAQ